MKVEIEIEIKNGRNGKRGKIRKRHAWRRMDRSRMDCLANNVCVGLAVDPRPSLSRINSRFEESQQNGRESVIGVTARQTTLRRRGKGREGRKIAKEAERAGISLALFAGPGDFLP